MNKKWNEEVKQFCENCRFCVDQACRKYGKQPSFFLSSNNNGVGNITLGGHTLFMWPPVSSHEWCGEWQPNFTQDKLEPTSTRT